MKHQPNPKIFDQIAEKIMEQIRQGVLPPGSKVPSLRRLSRQLGVNGATVNRAYWKLENDGFLECRPQSGFYVRKNIQIPENKKISDSIQVSTVKKLTAKVDFLNYVVGATTNPANLFLSVGFPGLSILPAKSLLKSMAAGLAKPGIRAFNYNWPFGYEPLRRQIAKQYFESGVDISPDQILLTGGCSESLNVCFRSLIRPGDIVAVESPFLPMMLLCLQTYYVKIVEIPMGPKEGMDLDILKKALHKYKIKTCFAMPNYSNPSGSLMPDENKRILVEMLAGKGASLVENDIYGDLYFGTTRPKPAKAFDKTGSVMLCSSFSKTLSPGLRVGWVTSGKDVNAAVSAKFMGNASSNAFNEAGLADFMERGEYNRHLRKVRRFLETNLVLFTDAITRYFPAGTRITQPQGGLLFWVELPPPIDALQVHREALAKNILVFPGQAYTLTPRFKHCLSIGFGHKWSDSMEKVLKTVGDLAKKQLVH